MVTKGRSKKGMIAIIYQRRRERGGLRGLAGWPVNSNEHTIDNSKYLSVIIYIIMKYIKWKLAHMSVDKLNEYVQIV